MDEKTTLQSYFVDLAFSNDGSQHLRLDGVGPAKRDRRLSFHRRKDRAGTHHRNPAAAARGGRGQITYPTDDLPPGAAAAYPAGFAVLPGRDGDRLLIADNLADNAVLLDATSGNLLKTFDLSTSHYVPSAYPYPIIANRALGSRGLGQSGMSRRSLSST